MNTKPILYDLGISLGAMSLWFTPLDVTRALGYTVSLIFSGRAYYTGITLLSDERKTDEKQAIAYEAETDFYDQLLGKNIDAALEVKAIEVENKMLERMIPLMQQKTALEKQLERVRPIHPELTEEEREQAARTAIEDAFTEEKPSESKPEITEAQIREKFPESMDDISWKAILKGLGSGSSRAEIVKDVLGCNASQKGVGEAYYDYLKQKFML
jgi:hypothetical protein